MSDRGKRRPGGPGKMRVEGEGGKVVLIDLDPGGAAVDNLRDLTGAELAQLDPSSDDLDNLISSAVLEETDDTSDDLLEHFHDWKVVQETIGEMSYEVSFQVAEPAREATEEIDLDFSEALVDGERIGDVESRKREAAVLSRAIVNNLSRHLQATTLREAGWVQLGASFFTDDGGDDRARMYFTVRRHRLLVAVGLQYERGRVRGASAAAIFEAPSTVSAPPDVTTTFREVRRGEGFSRYLARYTLRGDGSPGWERLGIQIQWGIIRFLMEIVSFVDTIALARGELGNDVIDDDKFDIGDELLSMATLRELAREHARATSSS